MHACANTHTYALCGLWSQQNDDAAAAAAAATAATAAATAAAAAAAYTAATNSDSCVIETATAVDAAGAANIYLLNVNN